ncbi:N-acyl amino acid synthase FeeM domain-containing protein [Polaromonas sp. SM01]|uniref:N-acyl amino acid synthase FeeM domain-containing protein n=1 Tax=Polaromonas sp. SM01 TaxID=3085630 RepID=UPI0029829283|nr:long-chain N-acyl amino acid synthase [Polaromonas sp. SM01]MDW5442799.1 long-chain N-acyl amino acid synthase [Polaromonas sp. SM01]
MHDHGDDWAQHPLMFTIRSANSQEMRSRARILLHRMYAWRGYLPSSSGDKHLPELEEDVSDGGKATLLAISHEKTIGTLTVGFDDVEPFAATDIFADEISELRRKGGRLCEFTSLAVKEPLCSREVLASLFHTAYIYANRVNGASQVIIEVNPRHVGFYRSVLSFVTVGKAKLNQKVNAPSVLMVLEFSRVREMLKRALLGDMSDIPRRSYYPFFFPLAEEESIVHRMLAHRRQEGVTDLRLCRFDD